MRQRGAVSNVVTLIISIVALLYVVRADGAVAALSAAWNDMVTRRLIVYQARGDHMISTSDPWQSGGSTRQVTTEMGVTPPGKLVPADWEDLTNESPTAYDARHRARIAEAKRLWPED